MANSRLCAGFFPTICAFGQSLLPAVGASDAVRRIAAGCEPSRASALQQCGTPHPVERGAQPPHAPPREPCAPCRGHRRGVSWASRSRRRLASGDERRLRCLAAYRREAVPGAERRRRVLAKRCAGRRRSIAAAFYAAVLDCGGDGVRARTRVSSRSGANSLVGSRCVCSASRRNASRARPPRWAARARSSSASPSANEGWRDVEGPAPRATALGCQETGGVARSVSAGATRGGGGESCRGGTRCGVTLRGVAPRAMAFCVVAS